MKRFLLITFTSITILLQAHHVLASSDFQVQISDTSHTIELDDLNKKFSFPVLIQLPTDSRDIQAIRINRNNTTYLLAAVWEHTTITLSLYSTAGKLLSSYQVFVANSDKNRDFSVFRMDAITQNNQALIQLQTVQLSNSQPVHLKIKQFKIDPVASTIIQLASKQIQDITYPPNTTNLSNQAAGNLQFNSERLAAGLLPVTRSSSLDSGCQNHVNYLLKNNLYTHSEVSTNPGYTQSGATAGMNSDLAELNDTNMSGAIFEWTTAIYHRLPMLGNNMRTFGWAISAKSSEGFYYACLNVYGGTDVYPLSGSDNNTTYYDPYNVAPIPYPGVNQHNILTSFTTGEEPDPIAAFKGHYPVGQPVSLTFSDNDAVTNLAMTLTDENGKNISGYFRAPKDSTDPNMLYQGNTVSFIPKSPLAARTTFKVKVTGKRNGKSYSKSWQFRTE